MGECEGAEEYMCWEELLPDALGLIFRNLPLQEVLTVVPRVCKSWGRVVAGPYCWQEIDIEEWSQQQSKPEQIGRMVELLVGRSGGSCRRISVSGLPCDPLLSFIGDHARALRALEIPRSEISDSMVETVAPRLANVTFLDISSCTKIGARALEAFGQHCKSLVGLRRVMHPIDLADKECQHDEARAIARSMPKLRHLEMGYMLIATKAVAESLRSLGTAATSSSLTCAAAGPSTTSSSGIATRGCVCSAPASRIATRTPTGRSAPTTPTTPTPSTRGSSWTTSTATTPSAATTRPSGTTARGSRTSRSGSTAEASARASQASTGLRRREMTRLAGSYSSTVWECLCVCCS
ncbi:unnamed protein product [Urochloa decumbens]|uniref:F-box domain-containing protein n=1 Tax=Urochloa decumbens TaxID=240449 RepID=A0ABC8ZU86_9POAL